MSAIWRIVTELVAGKTVTRRVRNPGPDNQFEIQIDAPDGLDVEVTPSVLNLNTDDVAEFTVSFASTDGDVQDQWLYGGITWLSDQVQRAVGASNEAERRTLVSGVVHYEDAGEGGFYDNAGVKGHQPRRVVGKQVANPGWLKVLLNPRNRPSASTFVYNRCPNVVRMDLF